MEVDLEPLDLSEKELSELNISKCLRQWIDSIEDPRNKAHYKHHLSAIMPSLISESKEDNSAKHKKKYGPLVNGDAQHTSKKPRLGDSYQAAIPPRYTVDNPPPRIQVRDNMIWEPPSVDITQHQISLYLNTVKRIIHNNRYAGLGQHYDEAKALYVLQCTNYEIGKALKIVMLSQSETIEFCNAHSIAKQIVKKQQKRKDRTAAYISYIDYNSNYYNYCDSDMDSTVSQSLANGDDGQLFNANAPFVSPNKSLNKSDDLALDYDDDDYCFSCGDGGSLLICDADKCCKVWHIHCAGLDKMPTDDVWYCPSHFCCEPHCGKQSIEKYMCSYCGNAYCNTHIPSNCIRYTDGKIEFLCHDCLTMGTTADHGSTAEERFKTRLNELHRRRTYKGVDNSFRIYKTGRSYEVDWWDFYKAVILKGGLASFERMESWANVGTELGLPANFSTNDVICQTLQKQYLFTLYPYERQYWTPTRRLPESLQTLVDELHVLQPFITDK